MNARNLTISETSDGFLITADARRPAPEFASLIHALANPCPYGGSTDAAYRRAIDTINAGFGKRRGFVPVDAPHWQGHETEAHRLIKCFSPCDGLAPVTRISNTMVGA